MVDYQIFDFPFGGGVNDKVAERVMPPGVMEIAENIRQRKSGEFSKRDGIEFLNRFIDGESDNTITKANSIHARNRDQLIFWGEGEDNSASLKIGPGQFLYSAGVPTWRQIGKGEHTELSTEFVGDGVVDPTMEGSTAYYFSDGTTNFFFYAYFATVGSSVVIRIDIYDDDGVLVRKYTLPGGTSVRQPQFARGVAGGTEIVRLYYFGS